MRTRQESVAAAVCAAVLLMSPGIAAAAEPPQSPAAAPTQSAEQPQPSAPPLASSAPPLTPPSAPPPAPPPAQTTSAEALFEQGMALMEQGRYAEACPKLEACIKLGGGLGARFNLADCYERTGRTASAWRGFLDVAAAAQTAGQAEREGVARSRAAALEPALSMLRIAAPPQTSAPGLTVRLDGVPLPPSALNTPIPLDPGAHRVDADAPGKSPWSMTLEVPAKPGIEMVRVPDLAPAPASATAPREPSQAESAKRPAGGFGAQKIAAVAVGGVGLAGLVIGAVFAVQAKSKRDESFTHCLPEDPNRCSTLGVALRDESFVAAHVSTVGFVVGGAALAGGVILYLTAPEPASPEKKASLRASVGRDSAMLTFGGSF